MRLSHSRIVAVAAVALLLAGAAVAAGLLVSASSAAGASAPPPKPPQRPQPHPSARTPSVAGALEHTFVSGLGNDANPCSRTSPCRNFKRAFAQTATGGEITPLDS